MCSGSGRQICWIECNAFFNVATGRNATYRNPNTETQGRLAEFSSLAMMAEVGWLTHPTYFLGGGPWTGALRVTKFRGEIVA